MSLLNTYQGESLIYRINPVAKLGASVVIAAALVPSIDWVSASVALTFELAIVPFLGVPLKSIVKAVIPLTVAAILGSLTILFYGKPSGDVHFEFFLIQITDGSISLALATMLRTLAIALPAVLLFITVDPTDLADGLGQILRLPARFVIGALAGLRLVGLFIEDRQSLELAQRARGIADHGRFKRFLGIVFSLLVLSIRRGSKLATAMEAKGFGTATQRTWARESTFKSQEWTLLGIAIVISALAVYISVTTGHWNFIGGS